MKRTIRKFDGTLVYWDDVVEQKMEIDNFTIATLEEDDYKTIMANTSDETLRRHMRECLEWDRKFSMLPWITNERIDAQISEIDNLERGTLEDFFYRFTSFGD